jgi:hypothetical protein
MLALVASTHFIRWLGREGARCTAAATIGI